MADITFSEGHNYQTGANKFSLGQFEFKTSTFKTVHRWGERVVAHSLWPFWSPDVICSCLLKFLIHPFSFFNAADPLEVVSRFPDLGPHIPIQSMQEFLVLPWFFPHFAGPFCSSCEVLVPPEFGICTLSADFGHGWLIGRLPSTHLYTYLGCVHLFGNSWTSSMGCLTIAANNLQSSYHYSSSFKWTACEYLRIWWSVTANVRCHARVIMPRLCSLDWNHSQGGFNLWMEFVDVSLAS